MVKSGIAIGVSFPSGCASAGPPSVPGHQKRPACELPAQNPVARARHAGYGQTGPPAQAQPAQPCYPPVMTEPLIPVPSPVMIPTSTGRAFPVRRIYCVGRNYAEHAREMGANPEREAPFFFSKPADAVLTGEAALPY